MSGSQHRLVKGLMFLFTITLSACGGGGGGSDTTAPVITLSGNNPQAIEVLTDYVELGATAQDNTDGNISDDIIIDSSVVDTSTVGSYEVTYNVSDAAGNAAVTVTRTVIVEVFPELSVTNPSVIEGGSGNVELVFTLTLSENATQTLTIDYASSDDTATVADGDYTAVTGTATINQGSNSANISVFVNGDVNFELDETFNLVLSNPLGFLISSASNLTGQGMISNDDDAEPNGNFTGTASINSTELSDLKGLIYRADNRLIIISPTANVLYDIEITNITLSDFSGTVDVYVNGTIEQVGSVTVSGTTDESSLQGSFSGGTGQATGSFSLTFDADNNVGAELTRIKNELGNKWVGDFYSVDVVSGVLEFDSVGVYGGGANTIPVCNVSSGTTVIPSSDVNIYKLANVINQTLGCQYVGTDYTGYGAVIDIVGTDDGLVFAVTNGVNAVFSVFSREP